MEHLSEILLLLGAAVTVVFACQRLHVPTALGYLLVGVILGPHTAGPKVQVPELAALAEFGVVFLLFTIGLNFSLPQLHALRHHVLGLGTGQVALTTAAIALAAWLAGLSAPIAFVLGAVFAQSSTTIIASLLKERGEEGTVHGRLGLAISVFQDVTAVPFLVIIPVLGAAAAADVLAGALTWALAKALLAFAMVFAVGRLLLRRLIHHVVQRRSAEMLTLTVLLIALVAAWTTHGLGLSLAFGAFLAGMVLGETEFRHQVEASIRPFRDVLLGIFFVGIGMLFDPTAVWPVLHWAAFGAAAILGSKLLIVSCLVRRAGLTREQAWRTALLLAVGGEFGLALTAVALGAGVLDASLGQIAIGSVLLSMVAGAVLIHFNAIIAARVGGRGGALADRPVLEEPEANQGDSRIVVIGGYGRVGRTVGVLLQAGGVPFFAFDTDADRVQQGRRDGHDVFYGDIAEPELLSAIRVDRSAMVLITIDDGVSALKAVTLLRSMCPDVPIIVRARNLEQSAALMAAGATHAQPEAIEASLGLGATALQMLQISAEDVTRLVQHVRDRDYRPVMDAPVSVQRQSRCMDAPHRQEPYPPL